MCCNTCVYPVGASWTAALTEPYRSRSLGIYLTMSLLWMTTLIIPPVVSTNPCPYENDYSVANCSRLGMTLVPNKLHTKIMVMDFSDNALEKGIVANRTFYKYKNLNELYLRNNSINLIDHQAFNGLNNLKKLDLTNNQLDFVPSKALNMVAQSIKVLILKNNRILNIRAPDFSNFVNLEYLDISGNGLRKVARKSFSTFSNLEVIKLHRNNLQSLPEDAFDAFQVSNVTSVQLGNNPWVCDCNMRWLREWLNNTEVTVLDQPILCAEPAINYEKVLTDLELKYLACKIQMKSSGYPSSLKPGANQTLQCKYVAKPATQARWQIKKNGLKTPPVVVPHETGSKFSVTSFNKNNLQISRMTIFNFQYEDIAKYECVVENILGAEIIDYKLTLIGVDYESVTPEPSVGAAGNASLDTRSIVIAVAVVSGVVLLIAIALMIFCGVTRMQRRKQMKQDAIVENVKQHFISNSEVVSMGDLDASKLSAKINGKPPDDDQVDGKHSDDHGSEHTNDSTMTQLKRPLALEENDPLYIFEQPNSPTIENGNTYVSFGSEPADPAEETYTTLPLRTQTLPHHGYGPRYPSAHTYESSHAGSATPLLSDRYTPSVFDSDEPIEDYAQYPVYDSLTNSLHHPSHVTHNNYPSAAEVNSLHSSFQQPSYTQSREHTYATLDANSGFYSLANRSQSPNKSRNDSLSSYSSGERGDGYRGNCPRTEPARRMSSFQYAQTSAGSHTPTPRTPVTARSTLALGPRNAPDTSYVSDSADNYGYHHHRPSPQPTDYRDYRDYRDMRYPTAASSTPVPSGQIGPGKKSMSMSVGNLGYAPLVHGSSPIPIGAGSIGTVPRKPPRIHQSREYIELTPQDRINGQYVGSYDSGTNMGSYITSPEAQQYSQNYGITPGTPV